MPPAPSAPGSSPPSRARAWHRKGSSPAPSSARRSAAASPSRRRSSGGCRRASALAGAGRASRTCAASGDACRSARPRWRWCSGAARPRSSSPGLRLEQLLARIAVTIALQLLQPFERLALLLADLGRHRDPQPHQQIARARPLKAGSASAFEPQELAVGRAGRHLHLQALAVRRRDLDVAPDRRLRERHGHVDHHVLAPPLEHRTVRDLRDHVEIAGLSAARAGLALAAPFDPGAVAAARRDADFVGAGGADASAAPTDTAGLLDPRAAPATAPAGVAEGEQALAVG